MIAANREIVGREGELAELESFLRDKEALPGVALLDGEAGIGKTTLWRGAAELGAAAGYRVLSCAPSEAEAQLSFTAAGDLLGHVAEEAVGALPAPQRRALASALLLEEAVGAPRINAPLRSPFWERYGRSRVTGRFSSL